MLTTYKTLFYVPADAQGTAYSRDYDKTDTGTQLWHQTCVKYSSTEMCGSLWPTVHRSYHLTKGKTNLSVPTSHYLLNVAARDTKEYVVKRILKHDFTDPTNKLWLVQWQLDGDKDETWEPFEVLNDVEAFHHYCAANGLGTLFPKQHPEFTHINRSQWQHKRKKEPLTTAALPDQAQPKKRSGRPRKAPVSQPVEAITPEDA